MKKTKLLLALCLAGCLGHAQIIYTYAGNGTNGYTGNGGFAVNAELRYPYGITTDISGNIYFADYQNNVIRKVSKTGIITNFAGNATGAGGLGGGYTGDGGQATAAELNYPTSVAIDGLGNMYIADYQNYVIRKVNTSGIISTFAGSGIGGYSGDGGAATNAKLNNVFSVAVDNYENVYIADDGNRRIRKVNTSGIISTFAGNGTLGFSGDGGAATSAEIGSVSGIAIVGSDGAFAMYIAEMDNNRIRKVDASGIITTVAGNGTEGFSGDGAAATNAELNVPSGVAFDASGNMYIADQINFRVRKVNTSGIISTFAGNGTEGYTGDGGAATNAELYGPYGITVDASNNVYFSDNEVIRVVSSKCPANAGPSVTNVQPCCGSFPGVQIGTPSVPNMAYSWSPGTKLSSTTIAQPTSSWTATACQIYTVTVSFSLCTTYTSSVQVCAEAFHGESCCRLAAQATGFSPVVLPGIFSVFPNPANGEFTISLIDKADYIQVIDVTGKLIFEVKDISSSEIKFDLSSYNKGLYFIRAKMGDVIESKKLIVE
jgi:hypothetical protein